MRAMILAVVLACGGCAALSGVDVERVQRLADENARIVERLEELGREVRAGRVDPETARRTAGERGRRVAEIAEELRQAGGQRSAWLE